MLELPEFGKQRWIIDGELRERERRFRTLRQGKVSAAVCCELWRWARSLPKPHGRVVGGEAGVRLASDPETTIGVDVAYLSAEMMARNQGDGPAFDGAPVVIAEIISPHDTYGMLVERRNSCFAAGVAVVWWIDPDAQTITIFEINQPPRLVNRTQELTAEPHLPGFRVAVHELFE